MNPKTVIFITATAVVATLSLLWAVAPSPTSPADQCGGYVYYNQTAMWGDTKQMQKDPQSVCYIDTDPTHPHY